MKLLELMQNLNSGKSSKLLYSFESYELWSEDPLSSTFPLALGLVGDPSISMYYTFGVRATPCRGSEGLSHLGYLALAFAPEVALAGGRCWILGEVACIFLRGWENSTMGVCTEAEEAMLRCLPASLTAVRYRTRSSCRHIQTTRGREDLTGNKDYLN